MPPAHNTPYATHAKECQRLVGALARGGNAVWGEHGLVHALEAKRQTLKPVLAEKDSRVRRFWEEYDGYLQSMIASEKDRADEFLLLRKKSIH